MKAQNDSHDDGDGDGDDDGDGDGGSASTGASTTGTGDATSTGAGTELVDVPGVGISEVAFYQGVKAQLVSGGSEANPAVPVVAGRDALVRVFPDVSGYDGQPVVARLLIEGQAALEIDTSLQQGSEDQLASTVNFDVPGAMLGAGARFRVELKRRQVGAGALSPGCSYPQDGSYAATSAESSGPLHITLLPIAYGGDGSNRLPDTSAGQIAAYEATLRAMYPTSQLVLNVHASVTFDGTVSAGGNGWDDLLNGVADFRSSEGAAYDEYYYGIFNPASSAGAFCGGGCVAGLGFVGGPGDDYVRAAIGLGFGGDLSTGTAAHEVGHNHGRDHAPCGTSGDPNFPHPGASIGVWGYDIVTRDLKDPGYHTDLMGYCSPAWVSDYNYNAFLGRIQAISGSSFHVPEEARNLVYERVSVGPEGARWLEPRTIERPPLGERRRVRVAGADGVEREIESAFFRYDHLDGGLFVFPQGSSLPTTVELEASGNRYMLAR